MNGKEAHKRGERPGGAFSRTCSFAARQCASMGRGSWLLVVHPSSERTSPALLGNEGRFRPINPLRE